MKKSAFGKIGSSIVAHKALTAIVVLACVVGGYGIYRSAATGNATPQYQVVRAQTGKIVQTVTGTGQISASNQLDVASQVSGTIQTINVKVGDQVKADQLLATIDPHDALVSLQSAQLSYDKLTEPAKQTDLDSARNGVATAYSNAFNTVSSSFIDLQSVMSGMNDLLYSSTGFLSDLASPNFSLTGQTYRATAGTSYDRALTEYNTVLAEYKGITRTSATSSIDSLISDTYSMSKDVANALKDSQSAITFISTNQPQYNPTNEKSAASNVSTWNNQISGDVATLLSAQNSIQSSKNSLATLQQGADTLDVQSQQLSLQQAQETYQKYFIRAPFDGIVGRIPVNVYGQAGASTVIATVIGNQKIATLSLNEVDAAKVKTGDPVALTFDAINNFTATGTVSEVDLVGTVTQGVVTYAVKVTVGTADSRIIPGMSINAVITTNEIDNVIVVPSSAIKSQGNANYVQTFSTLPQSALRTTGGGAGGTGRTGRFASSTGAFGTSTGAYLASTTFGGANASSTGRFGGQFGTSTSSTTRQFGGAGARTGTTPALTVSSATPPTNKIVTVGLSDDTNTQIVSGLSGGEWVVTKTIAASSATATAAPSLLSSLGAGGRAGGAAGLGGGTGSGTFRAGGTGAAARGN